MHELRFRQVHLDFHTSEHIPGIGSTFDPEAFVARLKAAGVNSVTCFSRCHHGWIYHDTKFPNRHPNLTTNLLGEQIRACHAADIRVPIYITVGWDHLVARQHPEWIERDEQGRTAGRSPLGTGGWFNLDFASEYVSYVVDQTQEVCELFGDEVDGFFFDIMFQSGVHSQACLERFARLGWDPADPARQAEMRELLVTECTERLYAAVREKNKDCTVFFNAGHIAPAIRKRLGNYSHLEIESLPTGGWGYMHFPMTVRYARTLGLDCLAMTGKFSETWGHFSSYKAPAALEYECFSALAQGSKCSVGDQLPPTGTLDKATYDLIGGVFRAVAEVEPWCEGARAETEIAVVNAECYDAAGERMDPRNLGAARILIEGRHQFDFVDFESDLSPYRVLILPDSVPVQGAFAERVAAFLAAGGALVSSGASGQGAERLLPGFPAEIDEDLEFSPDFLRPSPELWGDGETAYVMYEKGRQLRPIHDAAILGTLDEPYFNRTWDRFCSHAHTPIGRQTGQPAIVATDRVIHFAHPIFSTCARHSMLFHRDVVLAALRRLLPVPLVEFDGLPTVQASLTRQGPRRILHLLHYIPERRGLHFDVVESGLPIGTGPVRVRSERPLTVTLVPQNRILETTFEAGVVSFELPEGLVGRQMVCLE